MGTADFYVRSNRNSLDTKTNSPTNTQPSRAQLNQIRTDTQGARTQGEGRTRNYFVREQAHTLSEPQLNQQNSESTTQETTYTEVS